MTDTECPTDDDDSDDTIEYEVIPKSSLFGTNNDHVYVIRDKRSNTFSRDYMSNRDPFPITQTIDEKDAIGLVTVLTEWLNERGVTINDE